MHISCLEHRKSIENWLFIWWFSQRNNNKWRKLYYHLVWTLYGKVNADVLHINNNDFSAIQILFLSMFTGCSSGWSMAFIARALQKFEYLSCMHAFTQYYVHSKSVRLLCFSFLICLPTLSFRLHWGGAYSINSNSFHASCLWANRLFIWIYNQN